MKKTLFLSLIPVLALCTANAATTYMIDFGTQVTDTSTDYVHIGGTSRDDITKQHTIGDGIYLTISGSGTGVNLGNAADGGCYTSTNPNRGSRDLPGMANAMASLTGLSSTAISDSIALSGTNSAVSMAFSGLQANSIYSFTFVLGRANTNTVANNFAITSTLGSIDSLSGFYITPTNLDPTALNFDASGEETYTGFNLYAVTFNATTDADGNFTFRTGYTGTNVNINFNAISFTLIPEPSTSTLGLAALTGLMLRRKRK